MLVPIELYQIIITECSPQQVIVLKEKEGERSFPIFIHYTEALAIDRKLKNFQIERPLTHDLLKNLIEGLGGTLEKIVLNDLRDSTYYAMLTIRIGDREVEIDSRPSDALALAVRTNAPLFAEEKVIAQALMPE